MKENVFIGIGASAGGLEALKNLLPLLPHDQDYVYIIAQHLDPHKPSHLADILASYTEMPVSLIDKQEYFKANSIYIIPSGHNLICVNEHLLLKKIAPQTHMPTPSVDKLFSALSAYRPRLCVGIILSGTGHDGAEGVAELKKSGGITIAQDTNDALHPSMPQSAIKSGSVDYILPVEDIAKELESIIQNRPKPLLEIANLLREKEHFDISKYKQETITRRLEKRMLLTHSQTLEHYLVYLHNNPKEIHHLYQNILIGVTNFFRDEKAFALLEKVLLEYLKNKPQNYKFRAWSVGCSSGEEAYSLAILIDRVSLKLGKRFDVTIFATDIDEGALEVAKKGCYHYKTLSNVKEEILQNYFIRSDEGYQIVNSIRSEIIFTHHDILQDPPLINQDIISCRNLLIYIQQRAQEETLELFHSSLKSNGILFLGTSESILSKQHYFAQVNSSCRVYTKLTSPNPPKISPHYFSKHLQEKSLNAVLPQVTREEFNMEEKIANTIDKIFAREVVIVDANFSIVYKQGNNPFLRIPDGYVTSNIIDNLHKELHYDVAKLLNTVSHSLEVESTKYIEVALQKDKTTFVKIIASPLHEQTSNPLILLYFQEITAMDLCFSTQAEVFTASETHLIQSFKEQIQELKKENKELLDNITLSVERTQLLNEELQSSNEELQSANEELETSNEELQSSNEELHVAIENEQNLLQKLSLILNSTKDGIIGLDKNGKHTFVNDAAIAMLGYTEDELIGKNGHLLWHHTKKDGSRYLQEECTLHSSLSLGKSYANEELFWRKDGTSFEVDVLQNPIIEDGIVLGAVLSFHDITEKNRIKKEAQREHELADIYLNTLGTIVLMLDTNGNIININQEGCAILDATKEELLGKNFLQHFIPPEITDNVKKVFHSLREQSAQMQKHYTNHIIDTKKTKHLIRWTNNYIKDENGNTTAILASGIDITQEHKLSQKLFEQEHLYKLTFEEADVGIAHSSLGGKWIDANEHLTNLLGYTKEELLTHSVSQLTYPDDRLLDEQMKKHLLYGGKNSYHMEKRYIKKDGSIIWTSLAVVLLRDDEGEPLYFLKIIRDISQLKLLMQQLEAEKEKFERILELAPIPILIYDEEGNITLINREFRETLGYELSEIPTLDTFLENAFADISHSDFQKIKTYYENPTISQQMKQLITTKSKEQKTELLNAVRLYDKNISDKASYMISMLDITEIQKKDELMLAQSRQAAMGDMLSMIAHQWRQPLSVISMIANNIQIELELSDEIKPQELKKFIASLHTQTQYLSQTIDDFRDFFKPDKAKEKIALSTLLERLQNLVLKSLEDNHIELTIENGLDISLFTYPNQLIQVLLNLINNAKDAINETAPQKPRISITTKQEQNELQIDVCDNGGGIDPSIKSKIAEPYVTTKEENGTGLGLYMSKVIMTKQLHGKLFWNCESEGCCFSIALPMKETK